MKSSAAAIQPRVPDPSRPDARPLSGPLTVPADASLGRFGMALAALATGTSRLQGLGHTPSIQAMGDAISALGAQVRRDSNGDWIIAGRGIGGLIEPERPLDIASCPQILLLLAGVLAGHPGLGILSGALPALPGHWLTALRQSGARFVTRGSPGLPLVIEGPKDARPLALPLPPGELALKQALLLAGLCARGETRLTEALPCPDHSESLLTTFGASMSTTDSPEGRLLALPGQPELVAASIDLPGDASLAAIAIVAAVLIPGSRLSLTGLGLELRHAAVFGGLRAMGASLSLPEPPWPVQGVVEASSSRLQGVRHAAATMQACGEDAWILAFAATASEGASRFESWHPGAAVMAMLQAHGALLQMEGGDLLLTPGQERSTAPIALSPRLAMASFVLARARESPMAIEDVARVEAVFPGFIAWLGGAG